MATRRMTVLTISVGRSHDPIIDWLTITMDTDRLLKLRRVWLKWFAAGDGEPTLRATIKSQNSSSLTIDEIRHSH